LLVAVRAFQQAFLLNESQVVLFTHHANVAGLLLVFTFFLLMLGFAFKRLWLSLLCTFGILLVLGMLAYTGSRSAVIGLGVGLVFYALGHVFRLLKFGLQGVLLVVLSCAVPILAFLIWQTYSGNPETLNKVINSGFEQNALTFTLGGGTQLNDNGFEGSHGVLLNKDKTGWQVALQPTFPIEVNENSIYVFSAWLKPETAINGFMLRVSALSSDREFLARKGLDGWTTGDEGRAGGRIFLPVEANDWVRFEHVLTDLPVGTRFLTFEFANDTAEIGSYGLIDALQLEEGLEASRYTAGPRAPLYAYLGPLVPRFAQLLNPLSASGGRVGMWLLSLEFASKKPFLGYGFGSSEFLVQRFAPRLIADPLLHPHNFFLQLLLDGGSLTLVAFLMWWGLMVFHILRKGLNNVSLAIVAAVIACFVSGLFDNALYQLQIAAFILLLVGIGLIWSDEEVVGV